MMLAEYLKYSLQREQIIMQFYTEWCRRVHGKEVKVTSFASAGKADARPDFLVNGVPVEVKCQDYMADSITVGSFNFRMYLRYKANILWVRGFRDKQPVFTMIRHRDLLKVRNHGSSIQRVKGAVYKDMYVLHAGDYVWKPLDIPVKHRNPYVLPSGSYQLECVNRRSLRFLYNGIESCAANYFCELTKEGVARAPRNEFMEVLPSKHLAICIGYHSKPIVLSQEYLLEQLCREDVECDSNLVEAFMSIMRDVRGD